MEIKQGVDMSSPCFLVLSSLRFPTGTDQPDDVWGGHWWTYAQSVLETSEGRHTDLG